MRNAVGALWVLRRAALGGLTLLCAVVVSAQPLPGTELLTMEGDIASALVSGVDTFLLKETAKAPEVREKSWSPDYSSHANYSASLESRRQRLAHILGVREKRVAFDAPEVVGKAGQSGIVGQAEGYEVLAVRWPAFGDVHGEGLLIVPFGRPAVADVVAIPDADVTPEQVAGLTDGIAPESQYARRLAESGCRVLVPTLINRQRGQPKSAEGRGANLSNREFIYRSAFELGRHVLGYEVQKVLAGVDWFERERKASAGAQKRGLGVIGWGEGGLLALYAGALDTRVDAVCASGCFDKRENGWQAPVERNVFGILAQFGDAELAAMVAPRAMVVEAARGPEIVVPSGTGGAPGRLATPRLEDVRQEFERARRLVGKLDPPVPMELVTGGDGNGPFLSSAALSKFLATLSPGARLASPGALPRHLRSAFDPGPRHAAQLHELDRHNQWLLSEGPYLRQQFMSKLDATSLGKFNQTIGWYREHFYDQVIGRVDQPPLAPNARTRKAYDQPKWTGYEVVLDVFPDVIAYGLLLIPKDLDPGEKRPVVVCQHGLEGRPQDTIGQTNYQYYKAFSAQLAERGFVTFAPQNLYLFGDRFRTLQRKANPLGKTLFSIIVPQHQQITEWLGTLPSVDRSRIGFYGLSYGGKTAMRVPALVTNYCLSICSADFNDWVWKNASSRSPYSYVWTGEYEIFEFGLGETFNYAEMAALVAPRPFMVERGHFDGVAPDETVAYEFAKVRFLYAGKLGLGGRCAIEWFVGPHTINGQGSFQFLHKHLAWPEN